MKLAANMLLLME